MATVKKVKKAQRGGCVSSMSSQERTNFFRGGTEGQLRRAGNKQLRQNARAERQEERAEKRAAKKATSEAPKAQRGGCVSNMSGAQRQRYFQGGPSPLQKAGQALKDAFGSRRTKEERQEARAERKAARVAKKSAPQSKYGSKIKKAQSGTALTEMGKKTTRAAINKRTDEMAKSLNKASVFGKNYIAPGDSAKKKAAKKPVPKKKMGGKCKYGC